MADLTRPDRGEARARLDDTLAALAPELRLLYCRTTLWALASVAPDVLTFLLDRVDNVLDGLDAELAEPRTWPGDEGPGDCLDCYGGDGVCAQCPAAPDLTTRPGLPDRSES